MLPDFIKVKDKLRKIQAYMMEHTLLSHMGPLANIPVSIIFEGNKTVVVREDGSVEEKNLEEATAELAIRLEEVENMTTEMVFDKINRVTEEMAGKLKKSFYEQLGRSATEVGNVVSVSVGGKPFSIDMYFEMLEKIEIDFDEAGNPGQIICPVNPKLFPSIAKVISQAKDDPDTDRRYKAIMERKREEWRARESNRKLVG